MDLETENKKLKEENQKLQQQLHNMVLLLVKAKHMLGHALEVIEEKSID